MSWQAISWAIHRAPIPKGTPNAAQLMAVLVVLAEAADASGRGAYPSLTTIAECLDCSRRTVQRSVAKLAELGVIRPGDQTAVAHIDPFVRPRVWDLAVEIGIDRTSGSHARPEVHPQTPVSRGDADDQGTPRHLRSHPWTPVSTKPPTTERTSRAIPQTPVTRGPSTPSPPPVGEVTRDLGPGSTPEGRARARRLITDRKPA